MPWNDAFECMPVEKLKAFQLEKLKETVAWIKEKVPYYRNKFKEMGIGPDDIKSLEDVSKLPFTVKDDLRDNYPFKLCTVPMKDVVRVHASSGTTGKPITGPYTAEDLEQWTECMARNLWAAGIRKEDIVQNAYGYGLFTGGFLERRDDDVTASARQHRTPHDHDVVPRCYPFICLCLMRIQLFDSTICVGFMQSRAQVFGPLRKACFLGRCLLPCGDVPGKGTIA